jgi:hypothetical protein
LREVISLIQTFVVNEDISDLDIDPTNYYYIREGSLLIKKKVDSLKRLAFSELKLPKERFLKDALVPSYIKDVKEYLQKEGYVKTPGHISTVNSDSKDDDQLAIFIPGLHEKYGLELNLNAIKGSKAASDLVYLVFRDKGYLNPGNFYLYPNGKTIITRDGRVSFTNLIGNEKTWPDFEYILNILSAAALHSYGIVSQEFLTKYLRKSLPGLGFVRIVEPDAPISGNSLIRITMVNNHIVNIQILPLKKE